MNCYEFISKGNYDESVIQIVLFGFVCTVAGDGTTEDYLGEGWIGDGADPGRVGGYHGRIKSALPIEVMLTSSNRLVFWYIFLRKISARPKTIGGEIEPDSDNIPQATYNKIPQYQSQAKLQASPVLRWATIFEKQPLSTGTD